MLSKDDITPQDIPDQIHLDFYYAPNAETKKREIFFDLKFRLTGTHESISLAAMKSLHEDLAKTASLEERNDFAATNHGDLRAAKDNKKVKDWVQLHHRINLSGSDWNDEVFFELLFTKTNTEGSGKFSRDSRFTPAVRAIIRLFSGAEKN